jgi:hypothetical protein
MTKKISTLNLIITFSIILFIVAVIFKITKVDNSEPITVISKNQNNEIKQKNITAKIHNTAEVDTDNQLEENTNFYTPEEIVENIDNKLNKALMYKTPESIIDAIDHYNKIGDDDKANEFIEYLLLTFPDYDYK